MWVDVYHWLNCRMDSCHIRGQVTLASKSKDSTVFHANAEEVGTR